jgi:hypothetical protein
MKKLLVILIVLGLAAPAMAQSQWGFYGSVRTHLGWYDSSEAFVPTGPAMDGTVGAGDQGTVLSMSAQSRLGFRAKVSDAVSGVVEFGLTETTRAGKSQSPYTRLAFGQWNFGAGSLIIGKHYTPATFLGYSNMIGDIGDSGDANLLVGGLAYIGRQPQIRLTVAGFELALIEQNTGQQALHAGADIDRKVPRIEAAYVFRTPMIAIRPIAGYQTYKVDDETIDSFLGGLGISLTLGPAYIKVTGSYLQNAGNYGNSSFIAPAARNYVALTGDDAETMQGTFVAGFNLSPTFFIEAGIGYAENKVDIAPGIEQKQNGAVYYIQAPIVLAKGFTIIPEVGQIDRGDVEITGQPDVAQGRMTYAVANMRIDF